MKKIILGIVFVLGIISFTNAKSEINSTTQSNSKYETPDCAADAWRYGTEMAGTAGGDEYYWTSVYYDNFC